MNLKSNEWDASYRNKDNFVFYPHEEVIRFTSKNIRRKIGLDQYIDVHQCPDTPKAIDLGCGIGRHVKFLDEYGLLAYGIDLSVAAIEAARDIFSRQNLSHLSDRLIVGSLTDMPFPDAFFDFAVSHGVFDSMPFEVAQDAIRETARCMRNGGLFYIDLVSGDDSNHFPEFCGEEVVETDHEKGTIQSYFTWSKVLELVKNMFTVKEAYKIKRTSVVSPGYHARYHIVLEKPAETFDKRCQ